MIRLFRVIVASLLLGGFVFAPQPGMAVPIQISPIKTSGTNAITPALLELGLRRGAFLETASQGLALLERQPGSPVRGITATAQAMLLEFGLAAGWLAQAEAAKEPGLLFHSKCVGALVARRDKRFDVAVREAAAARQEQPGHPLPHLILALVHQDQSAFRDGEREALEAIKLEPELAYAHTMVGMARHALGRFDEADEAYQKAATLDPSDLRPLLGLAEMKVQRRDYSGAVEGYLKIIELNPGMVPARQALASSYFSLGDYGACISEGLEILKSDPVSLPALGLLSRASIFAGDYPGATTFLRRLRGAQPAPSSATTYQLGLCLLAQNKGEEALRELRGAETSDPLVQVAIAVAEQSLGRLDASAGLYEQALSTGTGELNPRIRFHRATLHLGRRQWVEAAGDLAQAEGFLVNLRADLFDLPRLYQTVPSESLALTSLGALYLSEGFLDAGAVVCDAALSGAGASNVLALLMRSSVLARKGEFDEAGGKLRRILELAPRYAPAHFAMGEIALSRNDLVTAVAAYEKSAALDPQHLPTWTRLALGYGKQKAGAKRELALRNWLRLAPDSPVPYNELANHLADSGGNLDEALSLATHAVQKAPGQGAVLDSLGWIHYRRNEHPKAIERFQQALKTDMNPDLRAEVMQHLGLAYLALGDKASALTQFDAAVATAPGSLAAENSRKLIGQHRPER